MLFAVGARRDALCSGCVTYRAAVAAISREVSDPTAGDHETIILPSSASRGWRVICTVAIVQELQQIQIKQKSWKKRGLAENKTIRGGYGMEVRKASSIPVTSIEKPLHHRFGGFCRFWDFLWGRSICPGATQSSMRASERLSGVKIPHLNKRRPIFRW